MNIEAILDKVVGTMNTRTVVGDPIEIQGVTLVPLINITFGFGAGGGEGSNEQQGAGKGTGGGGGARMNVVGVLVVRDGDVRFLATSGNSPWDKLLDSVPELLQKVKVNIEKGKGGSKDDEKDGD